MAPARRESRGRLACLGVDAGGTGTRAVLADRKGRRSQVEVGPANWTTLGRERCARVIRDAVEQVLAAHGLSASELTGACIALAGYYPPWHKHEVREALDPLFPGVHLRVEPDLVAAWAGATGGHPGITLVAGTGAVAYGRDREGRSARAGGWGPLFGDEGGGYWIGCEALRAVARCLDGRGPGTALTGRLWRSDEALARTTESVPGTEPFPGVEEMLRTVYRDQWPRERVAGLAPAVAQAATAGDEVALGILERSAGELAALVVAVARRLGWTGEPLRLAGVGGVLEAGAPVRGPLERRLAQALPNACWTRAVGSPVEGALLLAQPEGEL